MSNNKDKLSPKCGYGVAQDQCRKQCQNKYVKNHRKTYNKDLLKGNFTSFFWVAEFETHSSGNILRMDFYCHGSLKSA
jgi:hypothetical protein